MAILQEGQRIRGTYVVERYLGEGAFAEVYRVQHQFLGRQAMKVFKTPGETAAGAAAMLGEALLLSRLGHPNIIRVFDANIVELPSGSHGFFTMEYVPGGSLEHLWRSYGSDFMPVQEAVAILKQVCAGVAAGHRAEVPIVHRDIKPQNIMIGYDRDGIRARVSDFGLARKVNPLTLLASCQGTIGFKPPESFQNMDSCAADVWALGTTLYLLLTDEMPYPTLDRRSLDDGRRFLTPLRRPSLLNIAVDDRLDQIVSRCLAHAAEDRFPDAGALLADLERWEPVAVPQEDRNVEYRSSGTKPPADRAPGSAASPEALLRDALDLARQPRMLGEAADLLEEAITKDPHLREQYASRVALWRKGICM
jgi:serine/threonine protein kinase